MNDFHALPCSYCGKKYTFNHKTGIFWHIGALSSGNKVICYTGSKYELCEFSWLYDKPLIKGFICDHCLEIFIRARILIFKKDHLLSDI